MTEHTGLPVAGYKPQSDEKVQVVNGFKQDEERILRKLDTLAGTNQLLGVDTRWLAIGRTQLEQAFMAINRAVFQPGRVELPEDGRDAMELDTRPGSMTKIPAPARQIYRRAVDNAWCFADDDAPLVDWQIEAYRKSGLIK